MTEAARPRPIKVLVVNPDYYRSSGVTVAIRRLFEAMPREVVEFAFATCTSGEAVGGKEEDLGWLPDKLLMRLRLMSRNPMQLIGALRKLRRICRDGNYDILHIHHRRLALLCSWAVVGLRAKVVYTGHLVYGRNKAFSLARIDGAVAITKTISDEIAKDHPSAVVRCISNIAEKVQIGECSSTGHVICIARLDPVKNHEVLLRAWAKLAPADRAQLKLLGEGPLRDDLVKLSLELGISDTVEFCGFVDNVPERIAGCLFLVLSSRLEGQPMAILEGAMSAKPSLVSNVPGSRDTVPAERVLPNLFSPDDPVELSEMLRKWLNDPEAVAKEGARFQAHAEAIASGEAVAEAHVSLYDRVVRG